MKSAELSEAQLAEVNARLGEVVSETGWARTSAIGQIIVDLIFEGKAGTLSDLRNAWKNHSLRRLAARADCPLRKSALAETMAVYAVVNEERDLRSLSGISPSHIAVVVHAEPDLRRALLMEAAEAGWSVRVLGERLKGIRAAGANHPAHGDGVQGRRALAAYKKSLKYIREGLHIVMNANRVDKAAALELCALAREIALLAQHTSEAVKAASTSFGQSNPPRDASPSASAA